jgi:hypothetical protein
VGTRRKTLVRRIIVPVLDCAVSFVVGTTMSDAARLSRRRWPQAESLLGVAQRSDGLTVALPDGAPEILVLVPASVSPGTVAHECTHAAAFMLNRASIRITAQDHETLAHTVGHLVDDVTPWLAQARALLAPPA